MVQTLCKFYKVRSKQSVLVNFGRFHDAVKNSWNVSIGIEDSAAGFSWYKILCFWNFPIEMSKQEEVVNQTDGSKVY